MKKLLAALSCLLMLCSCDFIASDTESLLHPPALNREQAALNKALESALNVTNIVYKYPQRGDHRTPFVFYDMDGDGRLEAIVFYSDQNDITSTRTMILRLDAGGAWVPFHDESTLCDQVDFVQFANLLADDSSCMIVGWQSTTSRSGRSQDSVLSVYSLGDDGFITEIDALSYIDYLILDFDGDGLEQIITVDNDSQLLRLSLLSAVGRSIAVSATLQLCSEAGDYLQMLPGKLWDGSSGLYIDEIRTDTSVATEIVGIRGREMAILVGGERPADLEEREYPRWDHYTDTWRDETVLSMDLAGNGDVLVPYPVSLPGNLYEGEENPLKLTAMMKWTATGFVTRYSAVINEQEGYLVRYPDKWQGRASVVRDDEAAEWRFFDIDPVTEEPVGELLRIRADTNPELPINYVRLGSRGARHFYGYIPLTPEEVPGVESEEELRAMFRVLA